MLIANRVLTLATSGGQTSIEVRINSPEEDDGQWRCTYEIDWPDGRRLSSAAGVDAVQAIELALQMIGSEIYLSDFHRSGKLVWEKLGQGYGFPVSKGMRDLLVGEDKLYEG